MFFITYVVSYWTKQDEVEQKDSKYFNLFLMVVLLYVFVSFLRCLLVALSCVTASNSIHNKMVWSLLRAPVIFFDSNPIGTIMTRFTKDVTSTDFLLPMLLNFLLISGFKIIISAIFIIVVVPWDLIMVAFVLYPIYLIRKWSITAQNDAQRLDAISKGPLNTRFSSINDGLTSIRAYKKHDYYEHGFMADSDLNSNAKFTYNGVSRWSGIRYDMFGLVFVITNLLVVSLLK